MTDEIEIDFDSDFDAFTAPAEKRPAKSGETSGGIMALDSCAMNSVEISIREMLCIEPVLYEGPPEFIGADGQPEESNSAEVEMEKTKLRILGLPEEGVAPSPALDSLREKIRAHLQEHAA